MSTRSVGEKAGAFAVAAAIGLVAVARFLGTRPGESATIPAIGPTVSPRWKVSTKPVTPRESMCSQSITPC